MKVIKYFLKYTILFGLIGLAISGLMSLSLIGCHTTCKNTSKGYHYCFENCEDGCEDCGEGCFGTVFGGLYGCLAGCVECKGSGCIGGCFHGLWYGCDDCDASLDGFHGCVEGCKDCSSGYKDCAEGIADDCHAATDDFKKDEKDTKRAKNFLIYITSIFAIIGAVFGICIGIQEIRKEREKIEAAQRNKDLLEAVNNGDKQIAQALIEHGADINYNGFIDNKNRTVLQIAVEKNDKEIVSLLLEKGADVNFIYEQKTPLDFAKDAEIKKLLESHGAKTHAEIEKEEALKRTIEQECKYNLNNSEHKLSDSKSELLHQILSNRTPEEAAQDFREVMKNVSTMLGNESLFE